MSKQSFSTKIINTEFQKTDANGAITFPIYRNASFEFPNLESIIAAFKKQPDLYTYSRISNPTVANFERKVKSASGAENVIALSSGMASIINTFFAIAYAGSNNISSTRLFGRQKNEYHSF